MQFFDADGVQIAYEVAGDGPPILLAHGFGAGYELNWKLTGWPDTLVQSGRRVIGFDCRGHGRSGRPNAPDQYANGQMPRDVIRLLDHLGIECADVIGYSMGAWLLLPLLGAHTARIHSAILGGAGLPVLDARPFHGALIAAFEGREPPPTATPDERMGAEMFRTFALAVGNDLSALACVLRSGVVSSEALRNLASSSQPVLVFAGDGDTIANDPGALAALIPGAHLLLVPGCDHLTAVRSPLVQQAVLSFLDQHGL